VEKKKTLSIDDLVVVLVEVVMTIGTNPTKIQWDDNVFSRDNDVPLYVHMYDLLEIATSNQELNITVVQLWMM